MAYSICCNADAASYTRRWCRRTRTKKACTSMDWDCDSDGALTIWLSGIFVSFHEMILWIVSDWRGTSVSLILCKKHAPAPTALAKTNGLVLLGMCLARAGAPAFVRQVFKHIFYESSQLFIWVLSVPSLLGPSSTMFSAATSGSWSWSLSVCLAVRYQRKLPTLEVMLDPSHIRHKNILDHFNLATLVYHIFSFAFNLLLFLDHKIVIKFLSLAVGIHNSQCQNYKCT